MAVVSDPAPSSAYSSALHRLAGAQKPSHGVPAYTRYVNRPLGRRLAALSHAANLTPNQVTAISGVCTVVGIVVLLVLEPSAVTAVVVPTSFLVGYALDSADGQLARLRGGGSPAGEWLDHVVDAARVPAIHAAVLVATFRFADDLPDWSLLVPLGYLLVVVVRAFTMMLSEQLVAARDRARPGGPPTVSPPARRRSLARSLVLLPTDFGLLALVFLLVASRPLFAAAYAGLFAINGVWLFLTLVRRYREIAAPALSEPSDG